MAPTVAAALVAAPFSLVGALVMRWIEARARSASWAREDRLRFMKQKMEVYSAFLSTINWVANTTDVPPADVKQASTSLQSVLLLAPKSMVPLAQDLFNITLTIATAHSAAGKDWAQTFADFANAARIELGSESSI